jgi:hypothetical protein
MGWISYADLYNYNGQMLTSADGWASLLAGVEENAQYFQATSIAPMSQAWTGTAAELAGKSFTQTQGGLIANTSAYNGIKNALTTLNTQLQKYQTALVAYVTDLQDGTLTVSGHRIPSGYFVVDPNGIVTSTGNHKQNSLIPQIQDGINGPNSPVDMANRADQTAATALANYFPKAEFATSGVTTQHWQPEPTQQPKTVSAYGSLWQIAETEYGDGNLWTKIYAANPQIGSDPNLIYPGMKLTIPPLVDNPGAPEQIQPGQGP